MKMFKAQRKGYKDDPNEWLEGVIIQDGDRYFIHSPGSLTKPITRHYLYALCVEVEKETITEINDENND
jgi:hypothetical protein